jgi:hypothetical protein
MEGVTMDPEKEKAVWEWPPLKDMYFIGLCTYYQRFVAGLVDTAKLMTQLKEEKHDFQWSTEAEATLWFLKESLRVVPVLRYLSWL